MPVGPISRAAPLAPSVRAGARYETLDLLRGIGAVVVVLYHEAAPNIFALGGWAPRFSFLAVDLFFCLSGFVIAINYDARFARDLTVAAFLRRRINRLVPLYLVGFALALLTLLLPSARFGESSPWLPLTLALNLLLLPGATGILFPLNPPSWSLFLELWVGNLLYALVWRWLGPAVLAALVTISAIGLLLVAVVFHEGFDLGFDLATLAGGCFRVTLSFFLGVAVARLHARRPVAVRVPAALPCAIFVLLLCLPVTSRLVTPYQLFCIAIGFPALIYLGAGARSRDSAVGGALGDASYAAYAIHWPLLQATIWAVRSGLIGINAGLLLQWAVGLATFGISLALHRLVDVPVKRRLGRTVALPA